MKQVVMLAAALAFSTAAVAQLQPESGVVTSGPITALSRLDSLKQMDARKVEQRRRFQTQSWTTANGTRVLFVQAPELPMLDLRLVFDGGSARDGDLYGLASITSRMLDEGTATRSTTQIATAFESLGADFRHSSYRDMAIAELRVLTDPQFLTPALEVFTDAVANPAFPEENFKRIFQSAQIGQQQREQSPSAQVGLLFYRNLFAGHPYAMPTTGTPESIRKITQADLRRFHQRYYVARNAVLAMVGDVTDARAREVAEIVSNALPAGEPAPALPPVPALKKSRHVHLDFASQQTHILLGEPGITRDDPDYYALYVGNEILGGAGFGSQLTTELREKRGLTYGVSSGFTPMRVQGPFSIGFSTSADKADESLRLARVVLKDFLANGPSEQQVSDTIANIVSGYPLDSASNMSIVGTLGMIGFYGLPLDYMDNFIGRVQSVTAAQIKAAFNRHVHPDKQLLVTVGQKAPVWK